MEPENDFFDMLWVDTSPTYFKVTDDGYLYQKFDSGDGWEPMGKTTDETPLKKLDEYTSQYGGGFLTGQMPQHEIDSAGPWQQAVLAAGYPQLFGGGIPSVTVSDTVTMNTIYELEEALPGTEATVHCPGGITDPGIRCTARSIWLQVQHLNDFHRWSREKIADWIDELIEAGYDLSFKVPEEEQ